MRLTDITIENTDIVKPILTDTPEETKQQLDETKQLITLGIRELTSLVAKTKDSSDIELVRVHETAKDELEKIKNLVDDAVSVFDTYTFVPRQSGVIDIDGQEAKLGDIIQPVRVLDILGKRSVNNVGESFELKDFVYKKALFRSVVVKAGVKSFDEPLGSNTFKIITETEED